MTMVAIGAAGGGLLFGFDTSTMNSAIPGITETFGLGSASVGFVAAIALIGCAAGAWFAGPTSSRFGRTRVMLFAGALITAGSAGAAFSSGLVSLGLLRFLTGVGVGAASAVVPAYITEISPVEIRGRLGSMWQFAIVIGQLLGLGGGFALARLAGSEAAAAPWGGAAWRSMFGVVAILGIIYVFVSLRLPPSPNDNVQHARLSDLRGPRAGLKGIVWTGVALAALQQLVGISVVKTYSNTLWQAVGFSSNHAFGISMLTVGISIVSTIIAIAIMDKVGRRPLLIGGAIVMALSLGALAAFFSTATTGADGPSLGRGASAGALVSINAYAVAFGITWGPITWLMLSELFDSGLRTSAVAVATTVNWLTNWAVTRTFPLLADNGLGLAYAVYAVFAVVALAFAIRVLPETRGRRLA